MFEGEAERVRAEVCAFIATEMAPDRLAGHQDPGDRTGFDAAIGRTIQRAAGARGLLALEDPGHAAAFDFEAAYHDAPLIDTAMTLAGPPIAAFARPDQRDALLPRMQAGEIDVCIAYTEPEAGNDLSRMQTRAVAADGGFALTGTKWLITGADKADYCLTVAITDPDVPIRDGVSMFVVELGLPGVAVTGRETIAGYRLWDVGFDGVHVGSDALLGELNHGWAQLRQSVEAEQKAMSRLGTCARLFDALASTCPDDELVDLFLALQVGRDFALRPRSTVNDAVAKVYLTELAQRITRVAVEVHPGDERWRHHYLFHLDGSISVGTNELHRSAIARAVRPPVPVADDRAVRASATLLDRTIERVGERHAFGGPLATHQAVQHRQADMVIDHLAAVDAVERAAGPGAGELERLTAHAVSYAGTRRVAEAAHQLWGGTGYLAETGLGRLTATILDHGVDLRRVRARIFELLQAGGGWSLHPE